MGVTVVPGTGSRKRYYPKYDIKLGPFTGGVNLEVDPVLLGSNILQECVNYMVKDGGELRLRPQVTSHAAASFALPAPNYQNYVTPLGSVISNSGFLIPILSVVTGTVTGSIITSPVAKFYKYDEANRTWVTCFANKASTGTPKDVFFYNSKFFVLFSFGGLAAASNVSGASLIDVSGSPSGFKAVVFKDRIFVTDGNEVTYSDANPLGAATDWSNVAPHTSNNLGFAREDQNESVRDMCVYNDSLYISTYRRVYRLSFATDPRVDGDLSIVSDTVGGTSMQVYNGNLYICNGLGVYRLVTSYFVEVSEAVRSFFRAATKNVPLVTNAPFGFSFNDSTINMSMMDHYLIVGPLNYQAERRPSELRIDSTSSNQYLVYDLDNNTWVKWLFSAGDVDPIGGPGSKVLLSASEDPSAITTYIWVGRTFNDRNYDVLGGISYLQQRVYSMDAGMLSLDRNVSSLRGCDIGATTYPWIGAKFVTSAVDLGDSTSWKKITTTLLDANFANASVTSGSAVGYIIDNHPIELQPTDSDRLKFGGAYRFHHYAFYHDSLAAVITGNVNTPAELDDIRRVSSYVMTSRADIT
jgi:hypothetical protein